MSDNDPPNYTDRTPPNDVLELEYDNAQQRLQDQRETIKLFSQEGAKYLRLLLILIGAPIALLGALDQATLSQIGDSLLSSNCTFVPSNVCTPINRVTITAVFFLLLSGIANTIAGGFEAYGARNIVNPADIHNTISSKQSIDGYTGTRLKNYRDRILYNDKLIFSLNLMLGLGKAFLIFSLLVMTILGYRLLLGDPIPSLSIAVISPLLIIPPLIFLLISSREFIRIDGSFTFSPHYSIEFQENKSSEPSECGSQPEEETDVD